MEQFFIPYKENDIYGVSWLNDNAKGVILICPPLVKRSVAGIRYYVTHMATQYYDKGYSVFTLNYEGLGNSGINSCFTYQMMLDSIRVLIEYIKEMYNLSVNYIVGIGAGNFAALHLGNEYNINSVILMKPDFKSIYEMSELIKKGHSIHSSTLVDGYLETQYSRMTSNGSDATFSVMNFEEPDTELNFWDSLCGPFFGGEEEIVYYQFVKDLVNLDFFAELKKHDDVTIVYWGQEYISKQYNVVKNLVYVGKLTNQNYWFESSILFDNTVKSAVDIVCKKEIGEKRYKCRPIYELKTSVVSFNIKKTCLSINIRDKQCLGMLHSPFKKTDDNYPLIIFEHGLACDSVGEYGSWVRLAEKLSALGYYCYRYDHIGSGISGGKFEDTLYTDYVDDLDVNLKMLLSKDELKNRKVVIISWSFGAYVSLITSEKLKDKIAGYVFWSPLLVEGTATSKVKFFRDGQGGYRFPISPLWLNSRYLMQEKRYNFQELYFKIRKPLLLVTGELDNPKFNEIIAIDIKEKDCIDMKHVEIYNTGHCFSEETIDYVINSTVGWLNCTFIE